jgi:hypothetical protein
MERQTGYPAEAGGHAAEAGGHAAEAGGHAAEAEGYAGNDAGDWEADDLVRYAAEEQAPRVSDDPPDETAWQRPGTGEPRVDAALAKLDELEGLPVTEHSAVFEDVHRRLRDVLGELDTGLQREAGQAPGASGRPGAGSWPGSGSRRGR